MGVIQIFSSTSREKFELEKYPCELKTLSLPVGPLFHGQTRSDHFNGHRLYGKKAENMTSSTHLLSIQKWVKKWVLKYFPTNWRRFRNFSTGRFLEPIFSGPSLYKQLDSYQASRTFVGVRKILLFIWILGFWV